MAFSLFFLLVIMTVQINIVIWNCRGAAKRGFGSFIKDLRNSYKFSMLVLLEPKLSGTKADKVAKSFGFDGEFIIDSDGFVGGVWVFWDSSVWKVDVFYYDKQMVHLKVVGQGGNEWFFSACYARPQRSLKTELWNALKNISGSCHSLWVVAGYFNSVLSDHEIMGAANDRRSYSLFRECVEFCNLLDAGFQGPPYTWRRSNLRERLDRVLVNQQWF